MLGQHLDFVVGDASANQSADARPSSAREDGGLASARSFIGVRFRCCGSYARAYPNREGTAYQANCPRCSRPVRFKVGPGGTDARFFEAY